MSAFNAIKSHFKQSYDKRNLTLVVISYDIKFYETARFVKSIFISYKIYETLRRLVSKIPYEMTIRVKSCI